MEGKSKTTKLFGGDTAGLVTRLVKWSVAEHGLPSGRFAIHSLRAGGATCLYRPGVDLGIYQTIWPMAIEQICDIPAFWRRNLAKLVIFFNEMRRTHIAIESAN